LNEPHEHAAPATPAPKTAVDKHGVFEAEYLLGGNHMLSPVFKANMKRSQVLVAVLLVAFVASTVRADPKYSFRFFNAEVQKILEGYEAIAGVKLVVASAVTNVPAKITVEANSPTLAEAQSILKQALLDQAGIVVTPLKNQRVSITYNDALHREANMRAVRPSAPK
jgi:hypothetical protein